MVMHGGPWMLLEIQKAESARVAIDRCCHVASAALSFPTMRGGTLRLS